MNNIDWINLIDWVVVSQIACAVAMFLAVVCALFQQRIADYWRNRPNVKISAKHFSISTAVGQRDVTPLEIKIIDGNPTVDGKPLADMDQERTLPPHSKVDVKDFIKGPSLHAITIPYIDIYIENEGYYDVSIDSFFVEYRGWRKRALSVKGSRDSTITPVSLKYQELLYNKIEALAVSSPQLPMTVKAGGNIQFRLDPQSIRNACQRISKLEDDMFNKRLKRDYLAFTVIAGKYVIRQCSRIRIAALCR